MTNVPTTKLGSLDVLSGIFVTIDIRNLGGCENGLYDLVTRITFQISYKKKHNDNDNNTYTVSIPSILAVLLVYPSTAVFSPLQVPSPSQTPRK